MAEPLLLGMKEGVVRLALNPAVADQLPAAARRQVEAAQAALLAGELTVPSVEFVGR
jgi:basic membrane lipoprotein Med (substrate-binding protein (PBP1-ABC) superfamily)